MVVASVIYGGLLAVARRRSARDCSGSGRRSRVWMVLRWLGLYLRFRTDRWIVTGTVRTP